MTSVELATPNFFISTNTVTQYIGNQVVKQGLSSSAENIVDILFKVH
jgi:hypothetical protein